MKKIDLICDKVRYAEFPELKFGIIENKEYFDITQYLIDKGLNDTHNIHKFQREYAHLIIKANAEYQIAPDQMIVVNETDNHFLLIGELALLFLMYTDAGFLCHVLERIDEMFVRGCTVSDTFLHHSYLDRVAVPAAS